MKIIEIPITKKNLPLLKQVAIACHELSEEEYLSTDLTFFDWDLYFDGDYHFFTTDDPDVNEIDLEEALRDDWCLCNVRELNGKPYALCIS